MSKIEILGPKQMAETVLEDLRHCGTLHLNALAHEGPKQPALSCLADNPTILSKHIHYKESLDRLKALLKLLPPIDHRITYLSTQAMLPSILEVSANHLRHVSQLTQQIKAQKIILEKARQHIELLNALRPLLGNRYTNHHLGIVGILLDTAARLQSLREALSREFNGEYELLSAPIRKNSLAVAILLPRKHLESLQSLLNSTNIPEHYDPPDEDFPNLDGFMKHLERSCQAVTKEIELLEKDLHTFSQLWGPYYSSCCEWLEEHLEIQVAQTDVQETAMCFIINGWIPREQVNDLCTHLEKVFSGEVTLNELKISSEEMEDVPIILRNPPYFRPFEIFTRLLPLPRYTSFDPTPFLGLFFPIFFGMILGDLGYALILAALGICGWITQKSKPMLQDASKVLTVCSGYTALFGLLYGEFFGETGAHFIGLEPLIMERSSALMPMLLFTLAVGSFHILMGLALGTLEAFMHRHAREGTFRLLSLLVVTSALSLALTFLYPAAEGLRQPLLISIGVAMPALIITGGFLAPLEMLKHIGHIISYTRIMAVGMTSVMLAYIANKLAGEAGSIAAGIAVAFLLHLFNLILGVFAPTVHSLRLHYVEFFSKFFESGGRKYSPMKKH